MGLLDKIKDLFMEEETDEEELELEEENKSVYEEPKDVLPKVMRDTIKKEEETLKFEDLKPLKENKVLKEEVKKTEEVIPQRRFSFPVDFEEEVTPSRVSSNYNNSNNKSKNVLNVEKEVPKKVSELYPKKEVVQEKPKFRPTPVISPVYGILDKNYKKEEVIEKAEEDTPMKRPSKKVDFETVRKKAFGNLTDDIKDNLMCENCELYKEVKRISSISNDDLLYDMLVDDDKKDEPITLEKAYDNYEDFGVAYEPKREVPKIENNTTIINNNTEINIADKIEIEEEVRELKEVKKIDENNEFRDSSDLDEEVKIPSRQEKNKENKVDKDFFQLIDSMYKERVDE